ncbi:hypothetical protein ACLOJK_025821 [Asimina triloba]
MAMHRLIDGSRRQRCILSPNLSVPRMELDGDDRDPPTHSSGVTVETEASSKFISLCQRRPELTNVWKPGVDDRAVRSSSGSDMSLDDPATAESAHHLKLPNGPHHHRQQPSAEEEEDPARPLDALYKPSTCQPSKLSFSSAVCTSSSRRALSREPSADRDEPREKDAPPSEKPAEESSEPSPPFSTQQPTRRLSVQDRINLFENKQKEQQSGSGGKVGAIGKGTELRRLSSDVSSSVPEKAVLRRWSGASDMSIELNGEKKETAESSASAGLPSSSSNSASLTESAGLKDTASSQLWFGSKGVSDSSLLGSTEVSDSSLAAQSRTSSGSVGDFTAAKEEAASGLNFGTSAGRAGDGELKDRGTSGARGRAVFGKEDDISVKNQAASRTHIRTISGGGEHGVKDQGFPQAQLRTFHIRAEHGGSKDQVASQIQVKSLSGKVEDAGVKDSSSPFQLRENLTKADSIESRSFEASKIPCSVFLGRPEDARLKNQPAAQTTQINAFPNKAQEVGSMLRDPVGSQIQLKASLAEGVEPKHHTSSSQASDSEFAVEEEENSDLMAPLPHWRTVSGKVKEVGRKELVSSQMQIGASLPTKGEELRGGTEGTKLHRQSSIPEHSKKFVGKKSESMSGCGNGQAVSSGRKGSENKPTFDRSMSALAEPVQKVRQSKGNQELNDELQMKADELEKLFAAHKLRVPGDQAASSRRTKLPELQAEQATNVMVRKPVEVNATHSSEKNKPKEAAGSLSNGLEFDFSSLMKMVNSQGTGNSSKQQLDEFGYPEDFKGKFYDRYMQKRDAKLREEWGSSRAQKEARMKAMQESLERSRAELHAKFPGSADRQSSALHPHQLAQKLASFNARTSMKNKEQSLGSYMIILNSPCQGFAFRRKQVAEPSQSDEEEDTSEISKQTAYGVDSSLNETVFSDGSSRSSYSKKVLPNRTHPSSIPRTTGTPISRSSSKATNINSVRRRPQIENPLAQSVPNFSDLRKENTKPSTGMSKTSSRSQFRNYTRSKSINEDVSLVKEEKPRRSQSMRKCSTASGELKDASPLNSDGVVLTPLRFSKEQTEQNLYGRIPRSGEVKPFLRKDDGAGPVAGVGIPKLKPSISSENLKSGDDSEEMVDHPEDSPDTGKEDEEEEYERASENLKEGDFPVDSDNEKPRLSQESEKFGYPESENGEVLRSLSQTDDNLVSATTAISSKFNASAGTVQDSPAESPTSWNSRVRHPFSYTHDASDIEASADSPIGSPASWNSHSLSQMMEADAARMRKKWGNAQIPVIVANSSHPSRKDVTKGFKRLLKFRRKSRGAESLITDWVSASTTSEGDDDAEDGRDLANRSSEDLRKTRMGFSQSHSSYDGFNEGEIFPEQDQTLRSSIPAPPANFKLREEHLSGSSLKAPRSFFSLPSFRSKGSESKPR